MSWWSAARPMATGASWAASIARPSPSTIGDRGSAGSAPRKLAFGPLTELAELRAQADLIERLERQIHENPELPLEAGENFGQALAPLPCLAAKSLGVRIA